MGYSRKNPHLPDGWHAGNSRGRGGRGLWKSRWEGGSRLKNSSSGVIKNVTSVFQIFDFTESSSLSKYAFLTLNAFRFSFKDSAKSIIKVIKGENTKKARG